jgi:hypothetical protein
MRIACASLLFAFFLMPTIAQQKNDGPADGKAQKTYKHALGALHDRRPDYALDDFKKADNRMEDIASPASSK